LDDEVVVSFVVDELFDDEDDVSLLIEPVEPLVLPVPLAPMLDVLGLVELFAVSLELELEELGVVELDVELLGVLLVEPVALLVLGVVLFTDEALVPPVPDEPEVPLDCAIA
jgi:hypothetical protein